MYYNAKLHQPIVHPAQNISKKVLRWGLLTTGFEPGGLWAGVVWRCSTYATAAQSISSGNPNLAVNGLHAMHPPEAFRSKL